MKTLILTEEQVKRVVDLLVNEQQASEFSGGTDAQRMSHALLSKNFGLPDGANNENSYYGANIVDVINMSGTGERTKYLSVFKPANKYSQDPKFYYDSIFVNNEKLENTGTKSFRFVNGNVYATHNGLLALARAMDHMGGRGGVLTISFGSKTTGKEAEMERTGGGVKYDSNRALNLNPAMNMLEELLVALSVSQEFRSMGNFVATKKDATNEQLITIVKNVINSIGIGVYGFMDATKREEVIKNLTPKGFITNVDFDITPFAQKLISLQQMPDKEVDYDTGKTTIYNEKKKNQLNTIGDSFEENLVNILKTTYMKNFQIYVENYLPNSSSQIIPLIKGVKFNYQGLGATHDRIFHSYISGSTSSGSTIKQAATNYKTGN